MNFSYLKSLDLPKGLYEACREAELFTKTFPIASISSARRAGEFTVKMVYGVFSGSEQDMRSKSVFEMLTELAYSTKIQNSEWFDAAHKVRKSGNLAAHQGDGLVQKAVETLSALFYEVGYALVMFGIAKQMPSFDPGLIPDSTDEPQPKTEIEIELTKEYIDKLVLPTHKYKSESVLAPVEINKDTVKDSGANSKAALTEVARFINDQRPQWKLWVEKSKGTILITLPTGKTIVIAVKSGCPPLGKRINGVMELLPGVDIVLYAPGFLSDKAFVEQLRIFTKEEFLSMWNVLGLIRKKITSATYKQLREELGPDAEISTETYADSITVQSFSNSGKKTRMLNERLEKQVLLSENGVRVIEEMA